MKTFNYRKNERSLLFLTYSTNVVDLYLIILLIYCLNYRKILIFMEERSNDLPENVAATESSIRRYIHEGYKRQEIVTLLKQDFPGLLRLDENVTPLSLRLSNTEILCFFVVCHSCTS